MEDGQSVAMRRNGRGSNLIKQSVTLDELTMPPVRSNPDTDWIVTLRKENNSAHVVLCEQPLKILYGPRATIKLRKQTPDTSAILATFDQCIGTIYQGRMRIGERLSNMEWALIGSLIDGNVTGEIPIKHRLTPLPTILALAPAYNWRICGAVLKTQNHGKGLDRFVRHFQPDEVLKAAISIQKGRFIDLGWAVYLRQENRRCLLLDSSYGLTDETVFWTAMNAWATLNSTQV
jgi:hypothetical protein